MTSLTELPALEIVPGYEGFAAIHPHGGAIGLLILSEMFGVTPAMRDAARDFAEFQLLFQIFSGDRPIPAC